MSHQISRRIFNELTIIEKFPLIGLLNKKGNVSDHKKRMFSLSQKSQHWKDMKLKWAKHGNEVPVSINHGHIDDPERWTGFSGGPVHPGNPEWGDKVTGEQVKYRSIFGATVLEKVVTYGLGTAFWFTQFYMLYWNYEILIGHFYVPYQTEFTDEELGIPPDDAPDPEYWGNHGKKYGTYR